MQKKKILKGKSDFGYIVKNNGYFVDKTLFIKDFYENGDVVLLTPRPRRFGKTLNLSMIEYFFDANKKTDLDLFSTFKIASDKAFCQQHQNQYPVINVSLKSVRGDNWDTCFLFLKNVISELYKKHDYLLESDKLKSYEKTDIENTIFRRSTQDEYAFSLFNLSKYLKAHFDKETIIMVDEYDTPIIDGHSKNYYQNVIDFMRVFMGAAFKENPYLEKGLITGIMRVARESIFSEMNNIGVYTVTSVKLGDSFGFTEEETKTVLTYFGLQDQLEGVKKWYDGYKFGDSEQIYNPWSIVNFISRNEEGFKPWWVNTGTDSLIKERIVQPDFNETYNTLQRLISGETIEEKLHENFIFSDLEKDRELLWTLLTYSGYLTYTKEIKRSIFLLKIPNYEIKTVFQDIIMSWLQQGFKVRRKLLVDTTNYLLNNQLQDFEKGFKEIMGDTISYWDLAGEPEKVYQAYVLGMLAIVGDDYMIKSNRESGKGRYDIMVIPHDKSRYGAILEIKQIERNKNEKDTTFTGRINKMLIDAAVQIEEKKYYQELLQHQVTKIIKVPIVFAEKEPYIFSTH